MEFVYWLQTLCAQLFGLQKVQEGANWINTVNKHQDPMGAPGRLTSAFSSAHLGLCCFGCGPLTQGRGQGRLLGPPPPMASQLSYGVF